MMASRTSTLGHLSGTGSRQHNRASRSQLWAGLAALFISLSSFGQESAQSCGSLANAFGPFDYRRDHYVGSPGDQQPWSEKLFLVEKAHFTPVVEQLVKGESTVKPGPDLDYTLRVFPNHHRALATVLSAWERHKTPKPVGLPKTVECYFERAVRFRPSDNVARLLFASFLIKAARKPEASAHLAYVARNAGENAFTHFNLGMTYADATMYEEALKHAHLALNLGLARRDLASRLEKAGQWREPASASPEPSSSATSASAEPVAGSASQ